MNRNKMERPFLTILVVYAVCYVLRMVELLALRTDQGVLGEAFLHKLLGIVVLLVAMRYARISSIEIGFGKWGALKGLGIGLGIGLGCFAVAYGFECAMMEGSSLAFYVSAFTLDGNAASKTTFVTVSLCILFNVINVVMEEGIFRGLFIKLAERRVPFMLANVISALLFGLWHIALPIRTYLDGGMSLAGAVGSGATYILTTFLMAFQLGLLAKMTGGLWAPMGAHFVNNTIVNLLHVTSVQGEDALMFVRITVAQTLSFVGVLIAYVLWRKKQKKVARTV